MSEKITSFTQLRAWQDARSLATRLYELTAKFPADEKFGLISQIRRSSVSVAANLAEGFSRNSAKDKSQFYNIALGSLTETLSHAYIACDLGFLSDIDLAEIDKRVIDIHKMTNGLIKSARNRIP